MSASENGHTGGGRAEYLAAVKRELDGALMAWKDEQRLRDAAPEMLEALKQAHEALKGHDPEWPYMKAIRAAISKATGAA